MTGRGAIITLLEVDGSPLVTGPELDVYEATFDEPSLDERAYFVRRADGFVSRYRYWMPATIRMVTPR